MGGLFGGGSAPVIPPPVVPPAPVPAPTIDSARQSQQSQDVAAGRQGRAASILTSSTGDLATPKTSTKSLLGM